MRRNGGARTGLLLQQHADPEHPVHRSRASALLRPRDVAIARWDDASHRHSRRRQHRHQTEHERDSEWRGWRVDRLGDTQPQHGRGPTRGLRMGEGRVDLFARNAGGPDYVILAWCEGAGPTMPVRANCRTTPRRSLDRRGSRPFPRLRRPLTGSSCTAFGAGA